MVGDLPSGLGGGPSARPSAGNWPPPYPGQPVPRPRPWLAIAVALTAALAAGALVVSLTRPTTSNSSAPTTTAAAHTPPETTAAQQQHCDMYRLAAQAAQVETAGSDKALARIATTNGALLLNMAAANPALDGEHRDAARALAMAYGILSAKGSSGVATEAQYQAALDDAIARAGAMKKVCGGG